ncbi:hypothetical protein DEI89_16780 [Curtobacterium sp. MCBD17_030]|nr:hypothetical protein DEI89_16780 [Curtobacterium sp. MCBD17_030]
MMPPARQYEPVGDRDLPRREGGDSREAGTATLHLWMLDEQQDHDEHAMRRTILRIGTALTGTTTT